MKIYFSDFVDVTPDTIKDYGAFNISLINDLPLFIDPFLLFNSDKTEYQELHNEIIEYVKFLKNKSQNKCITKGLLNNWYFFSEVKQNWFGYSKVGNNGSGLGRKFADSLHKNLHTIFHNFGSEDVSESSHLEKLCLIREGIGRDSISDFTTNLIKKYVLEYTEKFAIEHVDPKYVKKISVPKVFFNYQTESWVSKQYSLPFIAGDYVLLTPRDILTKDDTWINRSDIVNDFDDILASIPNNQQRELLSNYFYSRLPDDPKKKDISYAVSSVINKFPELLDYYIKYKEENGELAVKLSDEKVAQTEFLFVKQLAKFVKTHLENSEFYKFKDTYDETLKRIEYLKQVIENNDGYKLFYVKGKPIQREADLQLLFRLTWYATPSDVNSEVNNGRGPVDYKISRGAGDKTLVEFKLAKNSKLKANLKSQVDVYEKANETKQSFKVILYFSHEELVKVEKILDDLKIANKDNIILIDARMDNKPSASNA